MYEESAGSCRLMFWRVRSTCLVCTCMVTNEHALWKMGDALTSRTGFGGILHYNKRLKPFSFSLHASCWGLRPKPASHLCSSLQHPVRNSTSVLCVSLLGGFMGVYRIL